MKRILFLGLMLMGLTVLGESHVYQGHYASGISKYTVKSGHVYKGHYASGISIWTTGESSGALHIYQGHYASGISKFTYKNGHLYQGHYASGISAWTLGSSSGVLHIYKGHYASGISKFTFKDGHVYRGHYASGISCWTFNDMTEVPDGLLVFLVTQVLEPEDSGSTPSSETGTGGNLPIENPIVVPVWPSSPIGPTASEPVAPEPQSIPTPVASAAWSRARTLRGVFEAQGSIAAMVIVKCGKIDRKGQAKISVSFAPLSGRKRTFRAQKVNIQDGTTSVSWPSDGLSMTIEDTAFVGALGTEGELRTADIGGALPRTVSHFLVTPEEPIAALVGYQLDQERLPVNEAFESIGRRWTFGRKAVSKVRLSYSLASGVFKGSFKAFYLPTTAVPKKRDRAVSVRVQGLVVNGEGVGIASSRSPAQSYSVRVE